MSMLSKNEGTTNIGQSLNIDHHYHIMAKLATKFYITQMHICKKFLLLDLRLCSGLDLPLDLGLRLGLLFETCSCEVTRGRHVFVLVPLYLSCRETTHIVMQPAE